MPNHALSTQAHSAVRTLGSGLVLLGLLSTLIGCGGDRGSEAKRTKAPAATPQVRSIKILGSLDGADLRGTDTADRKTFAREKLRKRYSDSYLGLVSVAVGPDGLVALCSANTGLLLVDARDPGHMKALGNPRLDTGAIRIRYPGYHRCENLAFGGDVLYVSHYGDALFPEPFLAAFRVGSGPARQLFFHQETPPKWLEREGSRVLGFSGVDVWKDRIATTTFRSLFIWSRHEGKLRKESEMHFSDRAQISGVAWCGKKILVAAGFGGLILLDSEGYTRTGTLRFPGSVRSVTCGPNQKRAYVSAGAFGVYIVDLTWTGGPKQIGRVDTPGSAKQVVVRGTKMWIADWSTIRVYDVENAENVQLLESVRLPNRRSHSVSLGLAARDDVVFAVDWYGLHALKFQDGTAQPSLEAERSVLVFSSDGSHPALPQSLKLWSRAGPPGQKVQLSTTDPSFSVHPRELTFKGAGPVVVEVKVESPDTTARRAVLQWSVAGDPKPKDLVHLVANQRSRNVGDPAPDLEFVFPDGRVARLRKFKGKTVVLAFFSTFCPTGYQEFPDLEAKIWRQYRGQNVVVLGVREMRGEGEDPEAFGRRVGLSFPVVDSRHGPGAFARMSAVEDVSFYPFNVIIKPDGTIGYMSKASDISGMLKVLDDIARTGSRLP